MLRLSPSPRRVDTAHLFDTSRDLAFLNDKPAVEGYRTVARVDDEVVPDLVGESEKQSAVGFSKMRDDFERLADRLIETDEGPRFPSKVDFQRAAAGNRNQLSAIYIGTGLKFSQLNHEIVDAPAIFPRAIAPHSFWELTQCRLQDGRSESIRIQQAAIFLSHTGPPFAA